MIGSTKWVQWTTVGSSTTSAVLFPRLRGHARQGALGAFLALSAPSTTQNVGVFLPAVRTKFSSAHNCCMASTPAGRVDAAARAQKAKFTTSMLE